MIALACLNVQTTGDDPATTADYQVRFANTADSTGIQFQYFNGAEGAFRIAETMGGGGICVRDFDNNGLPDIFFVNGNRQPPLKVDRRYRHQLFHQVAAGIWDAAPAACLAYPSCGQGIDGADFNADGFADLFIANAGSNRLLANNGDGTFLDATTPIVAGPADWFSSSAAFADLDRDGDIDLYVANYTQIMAKEPACRGSDQERQYCGPFQYEPVADQLLLNSGTGRFDSATDRLTGDSVIGRGLGVAVVDLTGDDLVDIYVANDKNPNFLFVGQPDGSFAEEGYFRGVAVSRAGNSQAGMGVAIGDPNRDGKPELLVTNFRQEYNTIYQQLAPNFFIDATVRWKLVKDVYLNIGWGAAFTDFDNNGWADLAITNGHVDLLPRQKVQEPMHPLLFTNRQGRYFERMQSGTGAYFQKKYVGRGLATADLNRDGRMDLIISHQHVPAAVLMNETDSAYAWLAVELVSRSANREAIGAVVSAETDAGRWRSWIIGGASYQSASSRLVHFGLGESQTVKNLTVRWPSGNRSSIADIAMNKHHLVIED